MAESKELIHDWLHGLPAGTMIGIDEGGLTLRAIGIDLPDGLEFWTVDEVAECLEGISDDLYSKLWTVLDQAEKKTPIGGDGSNGTVEYPDARLGTDEDDKMTAAWPQLTEKEKEQIADGYQKHLNELID